jgi:chitin synthase
MYNEGPEELAGTLEAISRNIGYMQRSPELARRAGFDPDQQPDIWKQVAVCIVSDGRLQANQETLAWLAEQGGVFDRGVCTVMPLSTNRVHMHLFENTWHHPSSHKSMRTTGSPDASFAPLQTIFALKEANAGKLNSHLWFFEAFAAQLNPTFTVLLDVGTMPSESAIFRLLRSMWRNPALGGVCGEIDVERPLATENLLNFVVAAQVSAGCRLMKLICLTLFFDSILRPDI